jgi:Dehydrogenase E1 component
MVKKSRKPAAAASAQAEQDGFSLISNETLMALYADLRKCQRAATNGTYDALPAGLLMDLGEGDAVVSAHADGAVRLKRKGKPAVQAGVAFETSLGSVLGAGLLAKTRKSRKVGVVFGGQDEAEWKDALAVARRLDLPLVFVSRAHDVDEKEVAREMRIPRKKSRKAKRAEVEGYLPRIHVDAHDVVAVYRVAHEAIDRARRGRGATWIEGVPFKPEGKRRRPDAVAGMEEYLRTKGLLR